MSKLKIEKKRGKYFIDGVPHSSITTIIGRVLANPSLRYWYGNVGLREARKISTEAASFGSSMHQIIAEFLRTGHEPRQTTWAEETQRAWNLWCEWYRNFNWSQFLDDEGNSPGTRTEETLVGKGYAGTADYIVENKALFDWKFSKRIYESNKIQIGAYSTLVGAETAYLVRISRQENNIEVLKMDKEELFSANEVFQHLLAVYFWLTKK